MQTHSMIGVLVLIGSCLSSTSAHDDHSKASMADGGLVTIVRDATNRFHDVKVAEAEGYHLQFGCVIGSDSGAMGLHYVNSALVDAGVLDPRRPQILIYEPGPSGAPRLVGADYLVIAKSWDAAHTNAPQLMGQPFQLFESSNRFCPPALYTLHVGAWEDNPGTFAGQADGGNSSAYGVKGQPS